MWSLSKLPAVPAPCLPPAIDKSDIRGTAAFALRYGVAAAQAPPSRVAQTPNGDEAKYGDKSAAYSKGLKQKSYGIVDPEAFNAFRAALGASDGLTIGAMNFEDPSIILGVTWSSTRRRRFTPNSMGQPAHLLWPFAAAMPRLSPPRPRSRWTASTTRSNSSSSIGRRCCAMRRSPNIASTRSPLPPPTADKAPHQVRWPFITDRSTLRAW
jgi:hypothetical protein